MPSSTCTWRWFGDESRRSGGRAKGWAAGGAAVWATGLALRQEDAELQPEFDLHREPGVKAKPQQSPSAGKERVQNLLAVEELEKYADAVVEEAEDVQMKKPEARRFLKAVAARKSSARYAPPPETPPAEYFCFILHELMRDPVSTANDQTQERDAIARWLRTKQTTDPISNVLLANKKLAPNFALRVVIA